MENIQKALIELYEINAAYGIDNTGIQRLKNQIAEAKVCIPIIGKFSSGKSALVNILLGYKKKKLLKEDITPQTAIPAEILYGQEDCCIIINSDGTEEEIPIEEYYCLNRDANTVKYAQLTLKNSFLEEIPDVMLVDMPGFESAVEIHNKVIDDYLPQSMAYIIAVPADDMIIRSSVGNILRELCLHDMPLCVIITKYDKLSDDFQKTFASMEKSLRRYIQKREVTYCRSSVFDGAEEVKEFLRGIQDQSQEILRDNFCGRVLSELENTKNYLITNLKSSELSESELAEKQEKLENQLNKMNEKFSEEKQDFDVQVSSCIEEIKGDVQEALSREEDSFITMVLNGGSIDERLNSVVRNTVTVSIQKRFIPKVERYLKRVAKCVNGDAIGDIHFSLNFNVQEVGKGITSAIVGVIAALILGSPILGLIAGVIFNFINKGKEKQKREEMKSQIRMKLQSEVYPKVMNEVEKGLNDAIAKQIEQINHSIEEEITTQRNTLEKAMADVRAQREEETAKKESLKKSISQDLIRIEEIENEL